MAESSPSDAGPCQLLASAVGGAAPRRRRAGRRSLAGGVQVGGLGGGEAIQRLDAGDPLPAAPYGLQTDRCPGRQPYTGQHPSQYARQRRSLTVAAGGEVLAHVGQAEGVLRENGGGGR